VKYYKTSQVSYLQSSDIKTLQTHFRRLFTLHENGETDLKTKLVIGNTVTIAYQRWKKNTSDYENYIIQLQNIIKIN
jgi:hypothetical protein